MHGKKNNFLFGGFTLLEVLVALILIAVGVSAAVAAISAGKFFLKQAENKAQAMRVALVKMEEYLAKPYSELEPQEEPITATLGKIRSQVNIALGSERNGTILIPYKRLESVAFYEETDRAGKTYHKSIRLKNIVPYPFMHTNATNQPSNTIPPYTVRLSYNETRDTEVPYASPSDPQRWSVHATVIGNPNKPAAQLKVRVAPEVPKECLVIYNVALNVASALNVQDGDTIYTGCFVDGRGPLPVEARTPILTQPLISNVVTLAGEDALLPGAHTIEIRWFKDTRNGKVLLAEGELMMVLIEQTP